MEVDGRPLSSATSGVSGDSLSYDDLEIGQIVGVRIEDSYAVAVVKVDLSIGKYGAAGKYFFTLKCLQPDDKGLWRRNLQYPLSPGFARNLFKLDEKEESRWRLLEGL